MLLISAAHFLPEVSISRLVKPAKSLKVNVSGDRSLESDETLSIIPSNPGSNLSLGASASASTLITNDDGAVNLSVSQRHLQ